MKNSFSRGRMTSNSPDLPSPVTIRVMSLTYADAVQWYYDFARFDPNLPRVPAALKLARMRQILASLDHPEEKFPSVLIAGTKGKGSTAALIERILRTAGYRTGLFTSPHLHSFRERIRVSGEPITQEQVIQGTAQLQMVAPEFPGSTFFEWVTSLAFTFFAQQRVDIAIVEVGLGGRLDCTNVLTPRVAIITPISFDHMDILGHTLTAIAGEKAGIIKPNVPVVVAPQDPEALQVIVQTAAQQNAPLINVPETMCWQLVRVTPDHQRIELRPKKYARRYLYTLPLLGPHQRANLATALAAIHELRAQGWRIPASAIRQGIAQVEWHARFEILAREPYIVTDGAHNRASAHELVRTLDEVFPNAKVHFIFGASTDKDIAGMLVELAPRAASLTFTQSHHARAATPQALVEIARPLNIRATIAPSVAAALQVVREKISPNEVICVTGSLFIAADARQLVLELQPET